MDTLFFPPRPTTPRWIPLFLAFVLQIPLGSVAQTSSNDELDPTPSAQNDALRVADIWDPLGSDREYWTPELFDKAHEKRLRRHWTFTQNGVPEPYRGLVNPLGLTPTVVQAGSIVYKNWCADCHGETGMGDGVFALSLRPSPALLAFLIQVPMAVDEYLVWSISEGGSAFGTDMPEFSELLSIEEIWAVISYMRAGFPTVEELDAQKP